MSKIKPQDHPDFVGGWVWTKLELDWINERIGTLEAALFQAQEAAKNLEARLTKTEGWLNEAMWSYGELKREQLANLEETPSSPVEDWEAIAADQSLTIALLKSEAAAQPAPVQEPVAWKWHQAPVKTSWGHGMVVADLAIDKDHTVSVYCERDQKAKVEAMFTPPSAQRQWVGLTDEEIVSINDQHYNIAFRDFDADIAIARAIEAKLKERNT